MTEETSAAQKARAGLLARADGAYRDFQSRLMPEIPKERIIGVRMPALRDFSKEFSREPFVSDFLTELPHFYYEENNLHACLIERIGDYEQTVTELDAFLPYVDNWATCDLMNPKVLGKFPKKTEVHIRRWLSSSAPYAVRFGIGCLMRWYLNDGVFCETYLNTVASLDREEYYIRMMQAWFFATALAKRYESTLPYIEGHLLGEWVRRKAIQKACESRRLTDAQKAKLRSLRAKE